MTERKDIERTLGGTDFGTSLKDLEDGDITRGYFAAAPEGDYENGPPEALYTDGMAGVFGTDLAGWEDDEPWGDGFMKRAGRESKSNVGRN